MPLAQGQVRDEGKRQVFDAKETRLINGAQEIQTAPQLYDHFLFLGAHNSANPQLWVQTETGAGAGKAIFVPDGTTAGGVTVGVAGATTNNAEELAGKNVFWNPSTQATNRLLVMEVRAKFVGTTTPADGDFYIGFSNVGTATSGLAFVTSATSTITSTGVTEFAGIGYSSIPSSGALFNSGGNNFLGLYSTKASTGAVAVTSPAQVKDSAFHIYRIELDASGNLTAYVDDVYVGGVAAAMTANTAMTPYIGVVGKNSHNNTATVDLVVVGGDLV